MYPRNPYVSVARRRALALKQTERLRKKGHDIQPITIKGRTIAKSFWGKGWCDHLESFADFSNRLPRGRTYARNGSISHLSIETGHIEAMVMGSSMYHLRIEIAALPSARWKSIKQRCAGGIGSLLELLQGRFSDEVMAVVADRTSGLFPLPKEIQLACGCPDWAGLCKHLAAVLYGIGHRLDEQPELLFTLRGVDAAELIAAAPDGLGSKATGAGTAPAIDEGQLGDIFGIDLDLAHDHPAPATKRKGNPSPKKASKAKPQGRTPKRIRPTGKSVARLRKRLGLSTTAFAQEVGVTTATVYRWEASPGRLRPRASSLAALSRLSAL